MKHKFMYGMIHTCSKGALVVWFGDTFPYKRHYPFYTKVLQMGFYWPSLFKDVFEFIIYYERWKSV